MFNIGQVAAVRGAFMLAGYEGPLNTMPVASQDERVFVLNQDDVMSLDVRTLEQVVGQVLGVKVWILASIDEPTVPFE